MKIEQVFEITLLILIASVITEPVFGDERALLTLPEVVVSASRLEASNGTETTIVDRETIEAGGYQDLPTILSYVPGLYVTGSSTPGAPLSVSIRGAETDYTLFLIVGMPVNNSADSRGGSLLRPGSGHSQHVLNNVPVCT